MRVFPLSNWTELEVWQYVYSENIPVVPLHFAKPRPVVRRQDAWIMVDDERMQLMTDEVPQMRWVRFRSLGCYPYSGAIESTATTIEEILTEMHESQDFERAGRLIDTDQVGSMEKKKKQEGYF